MVVCSCKVVSACENVTSAAKVMVELALVGADDGALLGASVGIAVGSDVGAADGSDVGTADGSDVGAGVGAIVSVACTMRAL